MDPMTTALLLQGGGQLAGNIVGDLAGGPERERARRDEEAALRAIEELQAEMGPSAATNADLYSQGAQRRALGALEDVYRQGGMDTGSRAAMQEAMDASGAAEKMNRGAITDNFAMRGAGGSGAEMAAQLANQQGYAQRNARATAGFAGDAANRALQAMTAVGGLAGSARAGDLDKARALDAVAQFNASQRTRKAGMLNGAYLGDADSANRAAEQTWSRGEGYGAAAGNLLGAYFGGKKGKEAGY